MPDSVVRAVTNDGGFRVITADTTATVRAVRAAQRATGGTAERLGDLVSATILLRETVAPRLRLQAIAKGRNGRGSLVADAYPDGDTRGLVQLPKGEDELAFGPGALLQVMRTMPDGGMRQGIVEVSAAGGVGEAAMSYLQTSEAITAMLAVATVMDGDEVRVAGGYVVQLLPEVAQGPLMLMTERIAADFRALGDVLQGAGATPDALLGEILYGMEYTRLEEALLRFACRCSQVRVVASLATLSREDILDLIRPGEVLEIACDYCRTEYQVSPAQLRGLLKSS